MVQAKHSAFGSLIWRHRASFLLCYSNPFLFPENRSLLIPFRSLSFAAIASENPLIFEKRNRYGYKEKCHFLSAFFAAVSSYRSW
jgi:hypothetical protein